jgi:hypothetical protein
MINNIRISWAKRVIDTEQYYVVHVKSLHGLSAFDNKFYKNYVLKSRRSMEELCKTVKCLEN